MNMSTWNKEDWNKQACDKDSCKEESKPKPDKIQAFDALFTNNQIQIYKILLPYLDVNMQKSLAIYIKFMELQHTLTYLNRYPNACMPVFQCDDTTQVCDEILPFCSASQKKQVEQFANMFSNMKNMQDMMETVNMMKEMFPDGISFGDTTGGDGCAPDISQIMQMFGSSFGT